MYEWTKDNKDYDYELAWETTSEQAYSFCEDCRLMLAYSASLTVSKDHLKKLRKVLDGMIRDPDYEPGATWDPEEVHTPGSCLSASR